MTKIVLDCSGIKKSFVGRWLVGSEANGQGADDPTRDWDAGSEWSVAVGQSGRLLVWRTHRNAMVEPSLEVFADFDDLAAADTIPENIIADAAAALGLEYEIELDL
jgi:hypothetical protein